MAADLTAAAAASAAAGGAAAFVGLMFGVPLYAIGCGLGGAFIGLLATKQDMSSWRAVGQFIGYGIAGAIAGNWGSQEPKTIGLVALLVSVTGAPLARVILARAEDVAGAFIDRFKGGGKP